MDISEGYCRWLCLVHTLISLSIGKQSAHTLTCTLTTFTLQLHGLDLNFMYTAPGEIVWETEYHHLSLSGDVIYFEVR